MENQKDIKKKYWGTIIYEESVSKDYIDILNDTHLQIAISPIHDKDIEKNGETKKAHRHVLVCYESATTESNFRKDIVDKIKSVGAEPIKSKVGYYEYLTHKNEENKAHYNEEDIIKLNGFKITENEERMSYKQIEIYKREIIKIIKTLDIHEYANLIDYLDENNLIEFLEVASNKTVFFTGYINSRRYRIDKKEEIRDN